MLTTPNQLFIGETIHRVRQAVVDITHTLDTSLPDQRSEALRSQLSKYYRNLFYFDTTFCVMHDLSPEMIDEYVEEFKSLTLDDYFSHYLGKQTLDELDLFGEGIAG